MTTTDLSDTHHKEKLTMPDTRSAIRQTAQRHGWTVQHGRPGQFGISIDTYLRAGVTVFISWAGADAVCRSVWNFRTIDETPAALDTARAWLEDGGVQHASMAAVPRRSLIELLDQLDAAVARWDRTLVDPVAGNDDEHDAAAAIVGGVRDLLVRLRVTPAAEPTQAVVPTADTTAAGR